MNKLKIILTVAMLGLVFACATNSFSQQTSNPPIVGGYSKISTVNKQVVAAANYAVKARAARTRSKIKLVSISCAEQQVVAGMNYRLHLKVNITRGGRRESYTVEAVVYKNLRQKYSLTSWSRGDCPTP